MTLTIGLTGGIASGKSLVATLFERRGVTVIDADQVSRQVVEPGTSGLAQLVAHFGPGILDAEGRLDRRRMREHVFADDAARRALEAILHPLIHAELMRQRDAAPGDYRIVMLPILARSGMRSLADRILVVDTPEEVQLARLVARDNIDDALARRMIGAQESRLERLAIAHDVLVNTGNPGDLEPHVQTLHHAYGRFARGELDHLAPIRLPASDLPVVHLPEPGHK